MLWYFLGCAVLIGCAAALINYGIIRTMALIMRLDRKPPKPIPATGHDAKSYSRTRNQKKLAIEREQAEIDARARALAETPLLKEAVRRLKAAPGAQSKGRLSLLDETIVEYSTDESL